MSFDMEPDNPGYPCDCGGSIEPDPHYKEGSDPPVICCQSWSCNGCNFWKLECEQKEASE